MIDFVKPADQKILLDFARSSIYNHLAGSSQARIDLHNFSDILQANAASFVTLTTIPDQMLRGCIGTLSAYQPFILDVRERAIAAATEDYRFQPLRLSELKKVQIEVSRLTPPIRLEYDNPQDLPAKLVPGKDGVILSDGYHRATFLPQVWEKIDTTENFLNQLCQKMGVNYDLWRRKKLDVSTYQVQEFHE